MVRYELMNFRASPTGTPIYVQTELVSPTMIANPPARATSLPTLLGGLIPSARPVMTTTPAGVLPEDVQTALTAALAPAAVHFVSSDAVVPSCDQGHVLFVVLGPVPASGDQIEVYVGAGDFPQVAGESGSLALALSGQAWTVTGKVGPQQATLGGCG